MRITKLFSKLRLVRNWQFGRRKREALSTENREHFFLFPYNLALFSQIILYVIFNNNIPLKISNPIMLLNFLYLEKWSVKHVFCPTSISEGCHNSCPTCIFLPSWQSQKNERVTEKSQKKYVFPTLGKKNTNLVLINTEN